MGIKSSDMEETCVEALPSLNIPCNPVMHHSSRTQHPSSRNGVILRSGSVSLSATPETPSVQLPTVRKYRRINGYTHKTIAYGSPEIVQKLFTGQLAPTYFNDICYGKRATPQEFRYSTPVRGRNKELWEPKQLSRGKTLRKSEREILEARVRKQFQLENTSTMKRKERMRKTDAALLREAERFTRGMEAYLKRLDREKQKYDAKIAARSKQKRKPKPTECF